MSTMPAFVPMRRAGANPALVLNADYRPLSLFPLSIWPWQDAVSAVFKDKVDVVMEHDNVARSQYLAMPLPSIVALRQHVNCRRTPAFTKPNIRLRDRFSCAYCGLKFRASDLTNDHVIPKSRGGKTTWENVVTACTECNSWKDDRTPQEAGMPLMWRPWKPSQEELWKAATWADRQGITIPGWESFLPAVDMVG